MEADDEWEDMELEDIVSTPTGGSDSEVSLDVSAYLVDPPLPA